MPSQVPDGGTRGWIVPIGGGEDKDNDPQILRRFVQLCGGAEADIAILPTASRMWDPLESTCRHASLSIL